MKCMQFLMNLSLIVDNNRRYWAIDLGSAIMNDWKCISALGQRMTINIGIQ